MTHAAPPIPVLSADSCTDETLARARLAAAVAALKTANSLERASARARIERHAVELARVLTRTGREHLASVLLPDEAPDHG